MDATAFIEDELASLKARGLYNEIRTIESAQGAFVRIDGREVLNLCSNNYLGLASHPRLRRAAEIAISQYGVGPGAVRTIAGTQTLHTRVEESLARFKGREAAILFQSGFAANLAVIPALVGEGDMIFSDELNHASIIDGCRLSKAEVIRYAHAHPASLREALERSKNRRGRKIVVTDGVFSMDGDIAPLPVIVEIAKEFGCMVMVDDAHGEGVLGDHGRGICAHFGVAADIEVGTLSKALGVVGGFVVASRPVVEWLSQRARPFLFSSAPTIPDVAACVEAIRILEENDVLVRTLWRNGDFFKAGIRELGFNTGISETPITPVIVGDEDKASALANRLFALGVFAQAIRYPTVARGKARVRAMISACHSQDNLEYAINAFERAGRETGLT